MSARELFLQNIKLRLLALFQDYPADHVNSKDIDSAYSPKEGHLSIQSTSTTRPSSRGDPHVNRSVTSLNLHLPRVEKTPSQPIHQISSIERHKNAFKFESPLLDPSVQYNARLVPMLKRHGLPCRSSRPAGSSITHKPSSSEIDKNPFSSFESAGDASLSPGTANPVAAPPSLAPERATTSYISSSGELLQSSDAPVKSSQRVHDNDSSSEGTTCLCDDRESCRCWRPANSSWRLVPRKLLPSPTDSLPMQLQVQTFAQLFVESQETDWSNPPVSRVHGETQSDPAVMWYDSTSAGFDTSNRRDSTGPASRASLNSAPVKFCMRSTTPGDELSEDPTSESSGADYSASLCSTSSYPPGRSLSSSEKLVISSGPSGISRRVQFGRRDQRNTRRHRSSGVSSVETTYGSDARHRLRGLEQAETLSSRGGFFNHGSGSLFDRKGSPQAPEETRLAPTVYLSPWNTGAGKNEDLSMCRLHPNGGEAVSAKALEWARETAHVIGDTTNPDASDEICYMLMRMNEERVARKPHFQRSPAVSPAPLVHSYSGVSTGGCPPLFRRRRRLRAGVSTSCRLRHTLCGRGEKATPSLEVLRMRPHGLAILGERSWEAMIAGIRIWAFLGLASIAKIELHLFYLELTTGHFKLAKVGNRPHRPLWDDPASPSSGSRLYAWGDADWGPGRRPVAAASKETVVSALKSGKYFPLENLVEVDRGRLIQTAVLCDPFLSRTELGRSLQSVSAMWSNNAVDPLVCASEDAEEMNLLIAVIRFLQFYNGVSPAEVVERGGAMPSRSISRLNPLVDSRNPSVLTSHISSATVKGADDPQIFSD
eukprot:Gregarina_sp_Poly_1__9212@NODE_567_length_7507_cov_202_306317_g445_i0_p2_GENE_NODE_567_length_7507_cov_202_306317_g445_i0NODE_567_length_7507_cov_202_306317_g445_i0_p2_ORF_typecomplete_len825_score99_19_NODE_567_length_7507_cov_202_306317_g445_i02722746